jgi:tungstate transport system substrate-binding protein
LLSLITGAAAGCSATDKKAETLTLATTTSTRDSGLLDVLTPMFKKQTGTEVKVVAVGSGQALAMGRRGDADVLLTHAPQAEEQFVEEGHGVKRRPVMYNDFVIVGPKADPAKIKEFASAAEAFRDIAGAEAPFASRGDESGTHQQEMQIWKNARIEPKGTWYLRAGSGMAATLRMASEKSAYTLTDRGTFLSQRRQLDLIILVEGDRLLRNNYAVIVVNPQKHAHVKHQAAERFAEFLLSQAAQDAIAQFGRAEYGEQLFFPNADADK